MTDLTFQLSQKDLQQIEKISITTVHSKVEALAKSEPKPERVLKHFRRDTDGTLLYVRHSR